MTQHPTIQVVQGDITRLGRHVGAIVNAANSGLLGGGGVDGAIHRAGGPEVLAACRQLRDTSLPDGLPRGEAIATRAGRLDADAVIHTVGPVFAKTIDHSGVLASCYRNSLRVADGLGLASVAFPTISAGIYGWPMGDATRIAVETVQSTPTQVQEVIFVAYNAAAEAGYRAALGR